MYFSVTPSIRLTISFLSGMNVDNVVYGFPQFIEQVQSI